MKLLSLERSLGLDVAVFSSLKISFTLLKIIPLITSASSHLILMEGTFFLNRKPESPMSRARPAVEAKDSTPKKQKQCNCKHSRCLKL